jgi:NADPH:quinone reductase
METAWMPSASAIARAVVAICWRVWRGRRAPGSGRAQIGPAGERRPVRCASGPLDIEAYAEGLEFPCPLGYEGAGTVVATGPEAGIEAGTRVCWAPVVGSCADYVTVPAPMLVPVPDGLGVEDSARLPSAGVTAQLLTRVWPLEARTAVVWGAAGPVGRMLVALLSEGGTEVIGVASGERVTVVRALGAAHAVDRTSQDVAEAVRAWTGGRGVTAVFDPVGVPTYRASLAMLGRRGCLINYGELSGQLPAVDLMDLMGKGLFVTTFGGGGAYLDALSDLRGLVANALAVALRRPQVISEVGGRFPLERAADGYQALESSPPGKILIIPDHRSVPARGRSDAT